MKKTYYLPTTDIIPHIAMRCVMEGSINGNNVNIDPAVDPDPNGNDALMQ